MRSPPTLPPPQNLKRAPVEVVQYLGGITSVLWGDNISTVGDNFSTVGDSFSTVEVVQYNGEIKSVHTGG